MKSNHINSCKVLAAVAVTVVCASWAASIAYGQALDIKRIDVKFEDLPQYMLSTGKAVEPVARQRWLRVEVEFETRDDWTDEIQLRHFIMLGSGQQTRVFTGEITYVNLPRSDRHVSVVYMHPNTLARYNNRELPPRVAVQMLYKDKPLTQLSWPNPTRDRWWENFVPWYGYVLGPHETPFGPITYERINQIKKGVAP